MTPAPFDYARPRSIAEALGLLASGGADALILAGGQTLVPLLARRVLRPGLIVDINHVAGLDMIEILPGFIRMGALVRLEQARQSAEVRRHVALLAAALAWVANPVVRRRGTVVGNLVANTPGAELPAVARTLDAQFTLGHSDEVLSAESQLSRQAAGGLVTHVLWPRSAMAAGFWEVSRRNGHSPIVGAAVSVGDGDCRVGVSGVCARALRAETVARVIDSAWPALPSMSRLVAALHADLDQPVHADVQANATYRLDVAPTVIRRAVQQARRAAGLS